MSSSRIDASPPGAQPQETPIPLWVVGRRRPVDRERRKNAGALSRHEEARTGTTPTSCLQRRNSDRETPSPSHTVQLWDHGG